MSFFRKDGGSESSVFCFVCAGESVLHALYGCKNKLLFNVFHFYTFEIELAIISSSLLYMLTWPRTSAESPFCSSIFLFRAVRSNMTTVILPVPSFNLKNMLPSIRRLDIVPFTTTCLPSSRSVKRPISITCAESWPAMKIMIMPAIDASREIRINFLSEIILLPHNFIINKLPLKAIYECSAKPCDDISGNLEKGTGLLGYDKKLRFGYGCCPP